MNVTLPLTDEFVDALIEQSMRTPYFHLDGYMERFWVKPPSGCVLQPDGSLLPPEDQDENAPRRPLPSATSAQTHEITSRVHHILRSDQDRVPHDHPWNYNSLVLRGGYWEVTPVFDEAGNVVREERAWYGPGSLIHRCAEHWHRLEVEPGQTVWTLFTMYPKRQEWGFLTRPNQKTPWYEYLADKADSKPAAGVGSIQAAA